MNNDYKIQGEVTIVYLVYRGDTYECLIDTEDLQKVSDWCKYKWRTRKRDKDSTMYVEGDTWDYGLRYMHRLLTDCPKGMVVDHINKNGLDNRKENLRIVSQRDNVRSSTSCGENTSGCPGVHWDKRTRKWRATIKIKGKKVWLGASEDLNTAIEYRKQGEEKYWGHRTE